MLSSTYVNPKSKIMKKSTICLGMLALALTQSCVKNAIEDTQEAILEAAQEEEAINENQKPTSFEIETAVSTTNEIQLDWTDSEDPEEFQISYEVYLDGQRIKEGLLDSKFNISQLDADTEYDIKVVALDLDGGSSEVSTQLSTKALETSVVLGDANVTEQTPTSETDFPILELPILVKDLQNVSMAAKTDIWVDFTIEGDVNTFDYEILTPSPVFIEEGQTEAMIKVQVTSNYMIEDAEDMFIKITAAENALFDEALSPKYYIIKESRQEDLSTATPNGPVVDITWSHNDANVDAVLFKMVDNGAQTSSSVAFYSTYDNPESFTLSSSRSDGSYFLSLERNDSIDEAMEVTVYFTQPNGDRTSSTLVLEANAQLTDVYDIVISGGVYTFTKK